MRRIAKPQTCKHKVLQITDWNALGAAVQCIHCGITAQISEETMEEKYYAFEHTSNKGKDNDLYVIIHHSLLEG